ncbi:MAG: winged helix-turn-helix transcriptional regulator [Chlorobium phaeobacteroides]|nr:winged helix-turn-helix transcriptional regulator [Chlorobium phaeobacteroides]MBL6957275.1 winged helix-turn-helix transcriptional regulator [Chlorobium phaeobacteroides]
MANNACPEARDSSRSLRALRRIIRALDVHSRRLYRECNTTSPQISCLNTLAKKGNQTLSALSQDMHLSVSTVNGIIDRLELRGMVSRTRSIQDQRKVVLSITQAGTDMLNTIPELMQDIYAQAFTRLSPENQDALSQLLEQLADHFTPTEKEQGHNTEIITSNHDFISNAGTDYQLH